MAGRNLETRRTTSSITSTRPDEELMQQIWVTPKSGVKVRHPQTGQHVPDTGMLVTPDSFWARRLADGDVVEGRAPHAAAQDDVKAKE